MEDKNNNSKGSKKYSQTNFTPQNDSILSLPIVQDQVNEILQNIGNNDLSNHYNDWINVWYSLKSKNENNSNYNKNYKNNINSQKDSKINRKNKERKNK